MSASDHPITVATRKATKLTIGQSVHMNEPEAARYTYAVRSSLSPNYAINNVTICKALPYALKPMRQNVFAI